MSDVDVTKLSNEQLMALINAGQPVQPTNAQTGQPLNPEQTAGVRQYAAAGGYDPQADPGTARKPLAQTAPGDFPGQGQFFFDTHGKVQQVPRSDLDTSLGAVNDRVRAFSRGVPILGGLADEADAATAAALAPTLEPLLKKSPHIVQALMGYDPRKDVGQLPTFAARYNAAENLQKFEDNRFDAAHPKESMAEQVGGGLAGGLAALPVLAAGTTVAGPEAGLLARSLAGAAEGGGIGAADAYGRGNGGFDDPSRLRGAAAGAAFGAAGGAALPVVGQVAKVGYRASVGRIVDALRGERTVQAPLEQEAADAAEKLRAYDASPIDKLNIEAALISAKRDPLKVNASSVDDAYLRIARALKRQEMNPQEAADAARQLGPLGVLADTGESTRDLLRAAMNRPGPGGTIAANNLRPRQSGIFDPETADWLARPSSLRISDQAQAGLGLEGKDYYGTIEDLLAQRKAASGPAYQKAYAAAPVAVSDLSDFAASPAFRDAYGRARGISQKEFVSLPDGREVLQPLPEKIPGQLDWRTLDLMKQAMDDTISEGAKQGIGANAQGASKGYLGRFVSKLDSLNPDYKPARDAFAGPSAMKDALEEGRGLLNEDAPTVAADLANRSESEREMLRLGALQSLQTKLGNANVTYDAANQAGFLKPNQLAKFKALFPDQKSFSDFYRTLGDEKSMFATNQAAFGNSSTVKQALNVGEASDPMLEGMSRVVESAPEGNIMGLIRGIHQLGQESPMTEDTAATIASVLSRHHGADMVDVVKRLDDAQRRAVMADILRKANGTVTGEAAARTVQKDQ